MKPTYPKMGEFQCEGCGKTFATKNELIEHENICDSVESAEEETVHSSYPEERLSQKEREDFARAFKGRQERQERRQEKNRNRNEESD